MLSIFRSIIVRFSTPILRVFLSALLLAFSGKAFAQSSNFITGASGAASYINPPDPTPDNIWFEVHTNAVNLLFVNESPNYKTYSNSAFWENVAWFSATGAQLTAQANGVKDDDFRVSYKRSLTLRTLLLQNVRLSTSDVLFQFRGSSSNHVTSFTLDNSTFSADGLAPSLDPGSTFVIHATNGVSTITNWVAKLNPDSALISVDSGASLTFVQCRSTEYPNDNQRLLFQSANNHAEVNGTLILKYSYLTFPTSTSTGDDGFAIRPGGRLSLTGFYTTLEAQKLTIQGGSMDLNKNTFVTNQIAYLSNATASIDTGALWSIHTLMNVSGSNTITAYNSYGVNPQSVSAGNLAFSNAATTLTLRGRGLFELHQGILNLDGGTLHVADTNTFLMYNCSAAYALPWTNGTILVDPAAVFSINQNSDVVIRSGLQFTNNGTIDLYGYLTADGTIHGTGNLLVHSDGTLSTLGTGTGALAVSNTLALLSNSTTKLTISPSTFSSDRIVVGNGGSGLSIDPAARLLLSVTNDVHLSAPTNFTLFDYSNFLGTNARFAGYSNGALLGLGQNSYRIIYNDTTVPTAGGYAISLYSQFAIYNSYWSTNSSGNWTNNPYWGTVGTNTGIAPGLDGTNSIFDTATFDTRGLTSGTGTVTLDTNASLTGMVFSNAVASYQVGGSGTISMTAGNTAPYITNGAGTHTIGVTLNLSTNLNIQTAPGTRFTLSGPIIGPGGLTMSGDGTATLTGTSTYTGPTTITGGTFVLIGTQTGGGALNVNGGIYQLLGTYSGAGSVTVTGGTFQLLGTHTGGGGISVTGGIFTGTGSSTSAVTVSGGGITPGTGTSPGTLSVGTLQINTGGTFNVLIASTTDVGQLHVTGPAVVGGTLNAIPVSGWNLNFGDRYQIMTAGGGISGTFASIAVPQGYRGRFLVENGGTGILLIAPQSYTQMAVTPNQASVARALNSFTSATGGDKQVVSTALDSLTASQYGQAFEAIAPTLYQSLSTMAFNAANAQYNDLVQQMFGLRVAGIGFSMSGFGDNVAILEGQGDKGVLDSKKDILRPGADTHWGMFVDGNGIFAQANSANMLQNYNAQSGGLIAGLTYKWSPAVVTGIYAGYEGTYAKFGYPYSGSTVIDNAVRFGLLGTFGDPSGRGFYGDALIGGTYNNYNVTRSITFPGMNRTANSSPGAGELDSLIAAGYNWRKGNWAFGPVSSLQYTYFGMNSFNETGAQSLDYQGLAWNTASMIYNLGGNCAYSWQATRNLMVVPQINLAWQHEFLQNPYAINGSLSGASVSNTSATPLRDTLYTGIGVTLEFKKQWNTAFFYNAAAGNQDLVSQNIFWSAGVKF